MKKTYTIENSNIEMFVECLKTVLSPEPKHPTQKVSYVYSSGELFTTFKINSIKEDVLEDLALKRDIKLNKYETQIEYNKGVFAGLSMGMCK